MANRDAGGFGVISDGGDESDEFPSKEKPKWVAVETLTAEVISALENARLLDQASEVASIQDRSMSNDNPKGENPHDGSEFGTEMEKSLDSEIVHEITENARDLDPEEDDRVVVEKHLDGLCEGRGILSTLRSKSVLTSLLFMAEHERSTYTPGEKRGEGLPDLLRVNLEYDSYYVPSVGRTRITFDVQADPETREIRRMGVHLSYVAETKRRLLKQGRVAL